MWRIHEKVEAKRSICLSSYPDEMTEIAARILELGQRLDPDERTVVAHQLLATLQDEYDPQPGVEVAWRFELRRRIDDIERGDVQRVSHAETVAMAREIADGWE